jgi:hypothetical protein
VTQGEVWDYISPNSRRRMYEKSGMSNKARLRILLELDKKKASSLHAYPGQHSLQGWVLVKPVPVPPVCVAKVADNMVVCNLVELLELTIRISF